MRAVRADFLSLKGLEPEHCLRLLALAGVQDLSEEDMAGLIEIARGNPLLLLDLGRVWCSGSWPRTSVPDTLNAVVNHRLASLDGLQTQVLSVVAAGNDLTSTDIESCLKLPTWEVVDALNVLVTLDLVEPHGARYGFRHSLLREAVTLALGPTRAREAHLRIGRWLADSGDGSSAEIVHHFRHANALDEAFKWAKAAASHARNAGALVEALQFFEIALESETEGLDPALCADAGRLALLLCQRDKGIRLLERAEALGDQPNPILRIERIDALSEDGRLDHRSAADQAHATAQEAATEADWVTSLAATETAIRIL
ncbi:MAG: hypothetical protein RLN75_02785, partial [Longimicrobiales bacterium]